jgi:hypothetical protein
MTPDRFRRLTEAYGASPEHWPAAERAAAEEMLARQDPDALAALAEARAIDLMLATHAIDAPDPDLVRRIVASAPSARSPSARQDNPPRWKQPRWWLSGAGFVGVGVAGIAAGVLAISLTGPLSGSAASPAASPAANPAANPPSVFDQSDAGTVFNGATSDWSDQ